MEIKVKAIGKVIKKPYSTNQTTPVEIVGIISEVAENYIYILRVDSHECLKIFKTDIIDFKATKSLSKEARDILKKLLEVKQKRNEEKVRYEKLRAQFDADERAYKLALTEVTGILTAQQFCKEIENLINTVVKASNYIFVNSYSDTEISFCENVDVEKWPSPEKYSFIYREYDNYLSIYSHAKECEDYKRVLKAYAPKKRPAFERISYKNDAYLSLGDKYLNAHRCYYVKHNGYTKASLEELKKKLGG